jgi:hypothetical protein
MSTSTRTTSILSLMYCTLIPNDTRRRTPVFSLLPSGGHSTRTFFQKNKSNLGWSSYAAVWLSHIPALIPGHFISLASTGEVRAAFDRQAADDWRLFLALRAQELRPSGRLVVVLPGLTDDGASGFEPLFNCANTVLSQLVQRGGDFPTFDKVGSNLGPIMSKYAATPRYKDAEPT